jgi:hypothetical protein
MIVKLGAKVAVRKAPRHTEVTLGAVIQLQPDKVLVHYNGGSREWVEFTSERISKLIGAMSNILFEFILRTQST